MPSLHLKRIATVDGPSLRRSRLHGAIADMAAVEDQEAALAEMRRALREYGMEPDVADEVVQQFAPLVGVYRATRH